MTSPDAASSPGKAPALTRFVGLLAVAEMAAVEQIGRAAGHAPDFATRRVLMDLVAERAARYRALVDIITDAGADPAEVMQGQQEPLVAFHDHTEASTWGEHLVKLIAGVAISHDLGVEAEPRATGAIAEVLTVAEDDSTQRYLSDALQQLLSRDPSQVGRLSLWARRLSAEALTRAQIVVAEDEAMAEFLAPRGEHGPDLAALTAVFSRMLQQHNQRMADLGLKL